MKIYWIISSLLIACTLNSCGPRSQASEQEDITEKSAWESEAIQSFYDHLQSLCNQSFAGEQIFIEEGRESWADRTMIMQVSVCEKDMLHIPFHMDEDHSRTWIFLNENGRLRFRHDHRHEDGTPEEITLYGGYADPKRATPLYQVFPADEYTINLIPRAVESEWVVELNTEKTVFSYQLHHEGRLIFQADFDLTNPL